jgi:hypothetical protein
MIDGVSMEEAAKNISSFMEYYNSGEWIKDDKTTYEKMCERMKNTIDMRDTEDAHIEADHILCEFLESLGFDELVTLYRKVGKWYS